MKKVLTLKKIWQSIIENDGSVSHLKELTDSEKRLF